MNLFKKGKSFDLEKSSLGVFTISVLSSLFNALFQLISTHYLDVPSFGELNTLLSFMTIVGITASMLSGLAVTYSAQYAALDKKKQVRKLFLFLQKLCTVFFLIFMALGVVLSGWLQKTFGLSSRLIVIYTIFATCVSIYLSVANGTLQGTKHFIQASLSSFFSLAAKSIFSIVLFMLSWQIFGAISAVLFGTILAWGYSMFCLHRYWKGSDAEATEELPYNKMRRFGVALYITQIWSALFTSGDVLLVKYYFSGTEVGLYSSAMIIGKMSTYITSTLVFVLLPLAAAGNAQNRHTKGYFIRSSVYAFVISLGFALVCKPVFQYIVQPILGNSYLSATAYIMPVALLMVPITMISMVIAYQTACNNLRFTNITLGLGIAACLFAAWKFHGTVQQMLYALTAVMLAVAICNIIWVMLPRKSEQ